MRTTTRMPRTAGYDGVPTVHTVRIPLWPYLVTPAGSVGLWAATAGAHLYWGDSPAVAGAAAAGLTLAGTALSGLTWRAAAARGIVRQAVSTVTCVAASAWTIGATLAGPWSRPWLDMWLIGSPAASIAMGVIRIMRSGPAESGEKESGGGLAEAVKSLRGATIGRARLTGARASAAVSLEPGTSISELAADRDAVASALDVAPTAVRVIPHPDSARRGTIDVVPVDQLREPVRWPGLSAPGESIAEPIRLGVMEDGEPLDIWLPGDHRAGRNAAHYLVVGMSGAGKTEVLLTLAAETLSRCDAELWIGDPRKGDQLPAWARAGGRRLAVSEGEVDDLLADLKQDVARRAAQLGGHGHKQWTRGCEKCPRYRVVIVDEASQVAAGNTLVTDLTESCRSVGISLIFGLQRASYDRFPTSARANIGGSICLGVDSQDDAGMALTDATLAAGAAPWTWKATRPGYLYAEVPGTEQTRWSMPCRSFAADEQHRAAAVRPHLPAQAARPAPTPRQEEPTVQPDDEDERELNAALDLNDPPDDVDPAQPITIPADMPRFAFGKLRQPPMKTAEARAWMRDYLLRLATAGTTEIAPAELGDVIEATGLTGSWVSKELRRLSTGADAILQRRERGVYHIRVPEPA